MQTNFQIGWKSIFIEFAVLFLVIILVNLFLYLRMKIIYKKLQNGATIELINELKRLQRITSKGIMGKGKELYFNNTCYLLASIALLNNNENGFLTELSYVKNEYDMKPFLLALYYKSKNDTKNVEISCQVYDYCKHSDKSIETIMRYLFYKDSNITLEEFNNTVSLIKNPAVIKLISEVM